jgi:hypothetical protein
MQHRATIPKSIAVKATQETSDALPIDGGVAGGFEHLEPEDIVTQVEKTDEVLKQGAPVPAAMRIAGKRAAVS